MQEILQQTVPSSNGQPNPEAAIPDPFDPARLRLTQDFGATLGVKKALLTIPVRKPSKEWFVKVHPDPSYSIQTGVLELKEDREVYLVDPSLWPELSTSEATFGARVLFTGVSRQGVVFLWPIRLPGDSGRVDTWNQSALEAAQLAKSKWVRVAANMGLGGYDCFEATATLPDPEWPTLSFAELLRLAFKNKLIDTLDHPVLTRLRGEQ